MTRAFHSLTLAIFLSLGPAAFAQAQVMSFQDWKTSRVEEAKSALDKVQQEKGGAGAGAASAKEDSKKDATKALSNSRRLQKSARADQKLQQAQLNLEVAQELTVNDYFVLYLSQLKDRESLVEAAKKLTPEEAAEILLSYQKQLNVPDPVQIIVPSTNNAATPTPGSQGKSAIQ